MVYIRCKACGYLMPEGSKYDICPACGVPNKMFEPYDDKVSETRSKLINLDIHPVMVHAPVALSYIGGLTIILLLLGFWPDLLKPVFKVLTIILVASAFGSMATGIFDAKVRFRKVSTPVLKKKLIIGGVFTVATVFSFLGAWFLDFAAAPTQVLLVIVSLLAMISAAVLGLLGAKLVHAKMPGK